MADAPSTGVDIDIVVCSDPHAIAVDAAYRFTALSAAAARIGKPFTVALAGGHTPKELYRLLASSRFRDGVDWANTHLFFGDERCVPVDSPFSNYGMVYESLIHPLGLPSGNLHRIPAEQSDAERTATDYATEIAAFFAGEALPRFDLILLGMGSDGHCASIFPGTAALHEKSRWVVRNEPGLEPFVPRITLTLPIINNAANILFLVAGHDKAETAARVLAGAPDPLPSQSVRPSNGFLPGCSTAPLPAYCFSDPADALNTLALLDLFHHFGPVDHISNIPYTLCQGWGVENLANVPYHPPQL